MHIHSCTYTPTHPHPHARAHTHARTHTHAHTHSSGTGAWRGWRQEQRRPTWRTISRGDFSGEVSEKVTLFSLSWLGCFSPSVPPLRHAPWLSAPCERFRVSDARFNAHKRGVHFSRRPPQLMQARGLRAAGAGADSAGSHAHPSVGAHQAEERG